MWLCLQKEEDRDLAEVCRRLMVNLRDGGCTLVWQQRSGRVQFDRVEINGRGEALEGGFRRFCVPVLTTAPFTVETRLAAEYYDEITKVRGSRKLLGAQRHQ